MLRKYSRHTYIIHSITHVTHSFYWGKAGTQYRQPDQLIK